MEEFLEDHPYGLGKLVMQSNNCSDPAAFFTPIRIRLPKNLNTDDTAYKIRIDYPLANAGYILIWKKDKSSNRNGASAHEGGDVIASGQTYTLNEIGYNAVSGGITLYVQGYVQCSGIKWVNVENNGRPDAFITAVFSIGSQSVSDQVKYIVVQEKCFFYRLQFGEPNLPSQDLRCLLAAKGVYISNDLKRFCLKRLTRQEIIDLGIPMHVASSLVTGVPIPGVQDPDGFKAGMYRDFISQKYIVAFAGTDDFEDVIEDIWQGLGYSKFLPQYEEAMRIAYALIQSNVSEKVRDNLIFTGHSLGGGLASAASVVADRPAVTFNAAGLNKKTLLYPNDDEKYDGSVQRFDNNGADKIKAYYMDYDILNLIQDLTPLPNALGNRIRLDSRYDTQIAAGWAIIASAVAASFLTGPQLAYVFANFSGGYNIRQACYECHRCGELLYGFLVKEGTMGNVVEDLLGL